MSANIQRHPSQQTRPQLSSQPPNNSTLTNLSTARNIIPQQTQSIQNHVRFNQDLLNNYGISVSMTRQPSQSGTNEPTTLSPSNSPSVTSLIPLPSPLTNNLGVNVHHMNQASITPTILGGFPIHQSTSQPIGTNNNFISPQQQVNTQNKSDHHPNVPSHHQISSSTHNIPTGVCINTRPMYSSPAATVTGVGKMKTQITQPPPPPPPQQPIRPVIPSNGTSTGPSTVVLRYSTMIQTAQQPQSQAHTYQMMKPRMMPPNAFASRGTPPPPPHLIMPSQTHITYDPNTMYRASVQQQLAPPQVQQTLTSHQANSHLNDNLVNPQKPQHQQLIQQVLHLPSSVLATDDNILKSLLQINPQAVSFLLFFFFVHNQITFHKKNVEEIAAVTALKTRNANTTTTTTTTNNNNVLSNGISTDNNDPYDTSQMNIHDNNSSHNYPNHHLYNPSVNTSSQSNSTKLLPNSKTSKPRKKRKPNDLNTSNEDDVPVKPRKRKSKLSYCCFHKNQIYYLEKGTEEAEKFVEHSLQQLRDLPMLIPLEPSIDINNELSLCLPFDLSDKKYSYQGEFGHVFIENINDYYRPHRRPPPKSTLSTVDLFFIE